MFKKLSISLTALVFVLALTCTSFSVGNGPARRWRHEVPIVVARRKRKQHLWVTAIAHTHPFTVDGDEKTLTIAPAETSDMQFGITRTAPLRATQ